MTLMTKTFFKRIDLADERIRPVTFHLLQTLLTFYEPNEYERLVYYCSHCPY